MAKTDKEHKNGVFVKVTYWKTKIHGNNNFLSDLLQFSGRKNTKFKYFFTSVTNTFFCEDPDTKLRKLSVVKLHLNCNKTNLQRVAAANLQTW